MVKGLKVRILYKDKTRIKKMVNVITLDQRETDNHSLTERLQ